MRTRGATLASMLDDYFGRRLESAEAASCLVVLLVRELLSAFDALEATLAEVLTEFFGMSFTSPPY